MKSDDQKAALLSISLPAYYVQRIKDEAECHNKSISSVIRSMAEFYWRLGARQTSQDNTESSKCGTKRYYGRYPDVWG